MFRKFCQRKFENFRRRYNKAKGKVKTSKKSGFFTKKSLEIAADQSSVNFMRWLDPFIVSRTSNKKFKKKTEVKKL